MSVYLIISYIAVSLLSGIDAGAAVGTLGDRRHALTGALAGTVFLALFGYIGSAIIALIPEMISPFIPLIAVIVSVWRIVSDIKNPSLRGGMPVHTAALGYTVLRGIIPLAAVILPPMRGQYGIGAVCASVYAVALVVTDIIGGKMGDTARKTVGIMSALSVFICAVFVGIDGLFMQ